MITFHRQDHIYKLCMICTLLMFITTFLNVVYLIRRSLWNTTNNEYVLTRPTIEQNYYTSIPTISNKYDSFEELYRRFLNSFTDNYARVSNKKTQSMHCPPVPPDLKGPVPVQELPENFSLVNQSLYHPKVRFGGRYRPKTCLARHKVAIIVPYRDRYDILKHFLFHTHTFLQRQQLDYRIYICEQAYDQTFNKGIVMNSCFKEILNIEPDTPCFIMHDVDLLLIDDRNMYTCPRYPRHLSVAIDKFHFYLPYTTLVGGVLGKKNYHIISLIVI